jgi:hypothetical protein
VQAVQGTLDGGTLRTVLDARNYILALSEARQLRAQWQRGDRPRPHGPPGRCPSAARVHPDCKPHCRVGVDMACRRASGGDRSAARVGPAGLLRAAHHFAKTRTPPECVSLEVLPRGWGSPAKISLCCMSSWVSEGAIETTSPAALGSAVWVKCTGTRRQVLSFLVYESLQAKAYNGSRYDCGRPNRRRSHNRASNMAFAERQDTRSSNYRQSIRVTTTEVNRDFALSGGARRMG